MRVKDLRQNLLRLDRILELYEGQLVDEMLDDIYMKVSGAAVPPAPKPRQGDDFDPVEAAGCLPEMKREEMSQYLHGFKKNQLIQIGKAINVKLSSKDNKEQLVGMIISRYDFIELNKQIAGRPLPEEGGFLQDVIDSMKRMPGS